mmetsp:Transcript_9189/g.11477  ORF Transcript_9189/g.11477 Transcript_9189/m.11477 type:complete len:219 (+) Transcript_9189:293-949(+)
MAKPSKPSKPLAKTVKPKPAVAKTQKAHSGPAKVTKLSLAKNQNKSNAAAAASSERKESDRENLVHSYAVWITKNSNVNVSENSFSKNLSDGVALCRILKKAGVPRVSFVDYSNSNNQMLTLKEKRGNIAALRRSCMLVGVKDADKLDYEDFVRISNLNKKLVPFLQKFSQTLSTKKYGIKPPIIHRKSLVKTDNEKVETSGKKLNANKKNYSYGTIR